MQNVKQLQRRDILDNDRSDLKVNISLNLGHDIVYNASDQHGVI